MTSQPSLLSRVENGIAWITLNRTEQRNALDIPTLKAWIDLLDGHEHRPGGTGAGIDRQRQRFLRGRGRGRMGRRRNATAFSKPTAGPKPPTG